MYVIQPSIDPLSEKNRELSARELTDILTSLRVVRGKPLLVQIGPFTASEDPVGVVNAYRMVKKHHDVRLVLAGTASDEPDRDRKSIRLNSSHTVISYAVFCLKKKKKKKKQNTDREAD